MKKFTHLLLTRFNMRIRDKGKIGCDPTWLENRFNLFDDFCYPTVYAQSNQNFKWLVFFDIDTPDLFKDKIQDYSQWKNFIPIYSDLEWSLYTESEFENDSLIKLKNYIKPYIDKDSEYLITTRIDNDDAVEKDYVQRIQKLFREQECEVLCFLWGYRLYGENLYLIFSVTNHFTSLVEKYNLDNFKTVYVKSHTVLYKVASVKKIFARPSWLEVVHGKNLSNRMRIEPRIKKTRLLNGFSIKNLNSRDNLFLLRIEQMRFFLGVPYYIFDKLYNRIKYHGFNLTKEK